MSKINSWVLITSRRGISGVSAQVRQYRTRAGSSSYGVDNTRWADVPAHNQAIQSALAVRELQSAVSSINIGEQYLMLWKGTAITFSRETGLSWKGSSRISGTALWELGYDFPAGCNPADIIMVIISGNGLTSSLFCTYLCFLYAAWNSRALADCKCFVETVCGFAYSTIWLVYQAIKIRVSCFKEVYLHPFRASIQSRRVYTSPAYSAALHVR